MRSEKEIREEIIRLRKKIKELENLLRLEIETDEATYIFTLYEDNLACGKYTRRGKYTQREIEEYLVIDRETLNKLFSWLVSLNAV